MGDSLINIHDFVFDMQRTLPSTLANPATLRSMQRRTGKPDSSCLQLPAALRLVARAARCAIHPGHFTLSCRHGARDAFDASRSASLAYMTSWLVPRLDAFDSLSLLLVLPRALLVGGSSTTTVPSPRTLFASKRPVRVLDLFAWSHCLSYRCEVIHVDWGLVDNELGMSLVGLRRPVRCADPPTSIAHALLCSHAASIDAFHSIFERSLRLAQFSAFLRPP
ncbi:hypothetical protein OG21DRAFT_1485938 [Imleria badia]|nr:hypothetical protein OG21DRAFT_1485938 [Imleria badia]